MSLLLKALQNAAKNRDAAGSGRESGQPAEGKESANELSLEPMPQPARAQTTPRSQPQARRQAQSTAAEENGERASGATPQQAQTVFRAGAPLARSSIFSWLAQRPIVAFSTAAGVFAIGYGIYLYLQITNPGIFVASRTPAPKPPVASAPTAVQPPVTVPPVSPVAVDRSIPPMAALAPVPGLPSPAVAPAPSPSAALPGAPPSTTTGAATSAPSIAAMPPAAQVPATPAPPAVAQNAPPAVSATPTRAPRTAAARPAAKSAPSEGIAPSATSQVVPVSSTLASAHQALEKGQLDDAERMYRQSLGSDPRSVDSMLGLAATLTQQNKADAATQYYVRALEQDPRNAYAQAGLLNLGGRADPPAAEARLKQLIAREPSAFLYFSLGNLYAEQGQWAGAQVAYFQAHNLAPDNPDYAFNLAVGLEHLSQPKIALNYYRRAVALAQSRGHAQFDTARVETRIRSLETALAEKP